MQGLQTTGACKAASVLASDAPGAPPSESRLDVWQRALLLGSLLFVAVAAAWQGVLRVAGPRIECEPNTVDLGVVRTGTHVPLSFSLRNRGWMPLAIHALEPDCGCWRAELDRWDVPGGEPAKLRASLDLAGIRGAIERSLLIRSNAVGTPITEIAVRGFAASDLEVSPARLAFGSVGESASLQVSVRDGGAPIRILRYEVRPPGVCAVQLRGSPAGRDFQFVAVAKRLDHVPSDGMFGRLEIATDDPDEPLVSVPLMLGVGPARGDSGL